MKTSLPLHLEQMCMQKFGHSKKMFKILISTMSKVRVANMTHDHDDTPHAVLTLLVVPAGKWVNL